MKRESNATEAGIKREFSGNATDDWGIGGRIGRISPMSRIGHYREISSDEIVNYSSFGTRDSVRCENLDKGVNKT